MGTLVAVARTACRAVGPDPDRNNIAPRLGFAWTANAEASMAVRGGYGIYYNQGRWRRRRGCPQSTV